MHPGSGSMAALSLWLRVVHCTMRSAFITGYTLPSAQTIVSQRCGVQARRAVRAAVRPRSVGSRLWKKRRRAAGRITCLWRAGGVVQQLRARADMHAHAPRARLLHSRSSVSQEEESEEESEEEED